MILLMRVLTYWTAVLSPETGVYSRVPGSRRHRPEVAGVMDQDIQINQPIQAQVDDLLGAGSEPFYPVPCVPSFRFVRDFPQNAIQDGVTRCRPVLDGQGLQVRVDAEWSESSASAAPTTTQFRFQPGTWRK